MSKVVGFNYQAVDDSIRKNVQQHTKSIKALARRSAADVLDIGRRLKAVRDILGSKGFSAWLKAEFEWSQATASNYMRAAEKFGGVEAAGNMDVFAMFQLARDNVPEELREEAIQMTESGTRVSGTLARTMIEERGVAPRRSDAGIVRQTPAGPSSPTAELLDEEIPRMIEHRSPEPPSVATVDPAPLTGPDVVARVRAFATTVEEILPNLNDDERDELAQQFAALADRLRTPKELPALATPPERPARRRKLLATA